MKKYLTKENGVSLVEIMAAVVLLSIILVSFFSLFLTSKKTALSTEKDITSTYSTQAEMETIYTKLSSVPISDQQKTMSDLNYTSNCSKDPSTLYLKKLPGNKEFVLVKLTPNFTNPTTHTNILVSSFEETNTQMVDACSTPSSNPKVQMENIAKVGGA